MKAVYLVLVACLVSIFSVSVIISCTTNEGDEGDTIISDDGDDDNDNGDDDDDNDSSGNVWSDSSSGLMWQIEPTGEEMSWYTATDHCSNLTLDGYSNWRIPTLSELRSIVRDCPNMETNGECRVNDGCLSYFQCYDDEYCEGNYCEESKSAEKTSSQCHWPIEFGNSCTPDLWFWSSSIRPEAEHVAWAIQFYSAGLYNFDREFHERHVRCVRNK